MVKPNVTLYVKSVKTVTGDVELEYNSGDPYLDRILYRQRARRELLGTGPKRKYVLPEDQQRTSEIVKGAASRYGLEVEVVDVSKENVIKREIQKEREKLTVFPTLIVSSGERIEGNFTESQVESLISRAAKKTRKTYV